MGMSQKKTESGSFRAIGIDLGTTNSAAAEIVWDLASGQPPVLRTLEVEQPTREGVYRSPLVPSVVAGLPLKRMMFVGIARATQWVYMSTVKGTEFGEMAVLREAADQGHLTMQEAGEWKGGSSEGGGQPGSDFGKGEDDGFSVL